MERKKKGKVLFVGNGGEVACLGRREKGEWTGWK